MDLHRDFFLENRRRLILLLETSFNFSFLWKILASSKRNCIIVIEFRISFLFFYFFSKLFNSRSCNPSNLLYDSLENLFGFF